MIEQYNIRELLSQFTLFVPEIQRDYVWGNGTHCNNVLRPFLVSLNHNLKDDKKCNVGFLYSYTNNGNDCNKDNYIIDGQQRFTTIVLLLYVLSVRESMNFDELIGISNPTTYFSYNVRPQTESFMRMLFKSKVIDGKSITNQVWFLDEYKKDMTISSMINAIKNIGEQLDDLQNITFNKVLDNICFWYFNVQETSQGEELYITMNSRGQKLTNAEQIKPFLFDQWQKRTTQLDDDSDYAKLWDDWEEMFYSKKGTLGIASVDFAINSFLRIVYEMLSCNECRGDIPHRTPLLSLPTIKKYMDVMIDFAENEWTELLSDDISYRPNGVLKALIAEGLKPVHRAGDIERVEHIFRNVITRRKYKLNHVDLLNFLSVYSLSTDSIYDFILNHRELSDTIFDAHEIDKITIYKAFEGNPSVQQEIEKTFAQAESRKVWSGNISPLLQWSMTDDKFASFSIDTFKSYLEKFDYYFADYKLKKNEMDKVRRALLAFGLHDYPRIFRGNTNTSFAYEPEDWHVLFLDKENYGKMKDFFDNHSDESALDKLIQEFPIEKDYSEFVHIPELLGYCAQKNIQWWYGHIYLISATNARSSHANIHAYKYYLTRRQTLNFEGWSKLNFWPGDNTCAFLDQIDKGEKHIAIDAYWNGGEKHKQMGIDVFMRDTKSGEAKKHLACIQNLEGFTWIEKDGRFKMFMETPNDERDAFILMDKKITEIINYLNQQNL